MKFVRQLLTIRIANCDKRARMMGDIATERKHGEMLPNTIRAIICGPSNCDKTNVLISLLESPHGDSYWTDVGWLKLTPQSKKRRTTKELKAASDSLVFESTLIQPSKNPAKEPPLFLQKEDVFETKDVSKPSFETIIKRTLQTQQGREALHNQLGPLGQKYISPLLDDNGKNDTFDRVYGVYFDKNSGATLDDKKVDVDKNDSIIIDNVRYNGTPGLRGHSAHNPIKGNRGSKYINIIAPLVSTYGSSSKKGAGVSNIPIAMKLNDNKIDYVHWDDPNELTGGSTPIARRFASNW
ncbi:hypothetical protein P5V15_010232 [Pogonomyrmex californicus]